MPLMPTAIQPTPAVAPRISLLSSARRPSDENRARWQNGFKWQPEACGGAGVFPGPGCGNPTNATKEIPDGPDIRTYYPFIVWAGDKCTPMQERDYVAHATRLLESCQSKQIEAELWSGAQTVALNAADANIPVNPHFADGTAQIVTAAPGSPLDVLGCLEQAVRDCMCGGRPMIHATPQAITHWQGLSLLRREGNVLLTALDTIVVPGAGYDGSGPDGTPAAEGSVWAYATSMVDVRLDGIKIVPDATEIRQAMNRATNLVEFRAERIAAATWDGCCLIAAEMDLPLCGVGS